MGYGLGPASASAFNAPSRRSASISVMGDGGFWHNGLTSGDRQRRLQQARRRHHHRRQFLFGGDRRAGHPVLARRQPIARPSNIRSTKAVKGIGVEWVRQIDRTYDVGKMRDTLQRGADHEGEGSEGHRRVVGMHAQQAAPREAAGRQGGQATASAWCKPRFGVDEDVCTGDHACIRLSGCPSLSVKHARRSAARRSGGGDRQDLRRLRQLRRGGGGRRALPVLLPRRRHPQSEPAGTVRSDRIRSAVIGLLQRRRERRRRDLRRCLTAQRR